MKTHIRLPFLAYLVTSCGLLVGTTGCQKETAIPVIQEAEPQPALFDFSRQFTTAAGDTGISQTYPASGVSYQAQRLPAGLTVLLSPKPDLLVAGPGADPGAKDFETLSFSIPTAQLTTAGTGVYPLVPAGASFEYRYGRRYGTDPGTTSMSYRSSNTTYSGTITVTKYSQQHKAISGNYELRLTSIPHPVYQLGSLPAPDRVNATIKGTFTDLLLTR
ncbi:hypothetical protein [Hymenobacter rubripertinctus]|nr:hypothetical protein [Hymenobacter rubripertinctus]